jgi:hypothetical protein
MEGIKRIYRTIFILCFACSGAFSQTKTYFIEFTDKNNSLFSLQNPSEFLSLRAIDRRIKQNITITTRDLPVNAAYVQAIRQAGANVWYTSRWMNGALIEADSTSLASLKTLPFVKQSPSGNWQRVNARLTATNKPVSKKQNASDKNARFSESPEPVIDYGFSANQITMIGADQMHKSGYTGKGMWIAVFDAGFRNADQVSSLQHVFANNRILGTYDFVDKETSVYEDDSHGLQVLSAMAAYKPGEIIGTAFEASYLLLRTEKSGSENRVEEINWLLAAEYADSVGVDVINSSLGYNYFDDPAMNYSRADMNGNTAFSTRAADMAAATGILVVNSAGNEGNDSWQTLAAPADADSVLTVGAVNSTGMYATFSSKGPSADRRIKPDVSAQGQGTVLSSPSGNTIVSNGTSFSAPVIAGMAASFWQAFPTLTNMQVIDYLKRSASQFDSPDSLLGYGIPNYVKAAQLAEEELKTGEEICRIWPNPISNQEFTLWVNSAYVKEPLTIRIYDMAGRIINQQTILSAASTNTLSLASSFFPRGTYLLQVTSPSIRYVSRFMKL